MIKRVLKWTAAGIGLLAVGFAASWLAFMPNSQERGVWRLNSGGVIITLGPLQAKLYSETSHSCYLDLTFPAHMKLVEMLEGAKVERVGEQLSLFVDGSLETRYFDRIDALPATCGPVSPQTATPRDVFDAFWTAMNEHYAFFDLHGVDWAARKALAPPPDAQMTDDALETLLLDTSAGLDDGHVHFGTPERGYASPSERPTWMPADGSLSRARLIEIATDNIGVTLTTSDTAPMQYGVRPDGIGYVVIHAMDVDKPLGVSSTQAMAKAFGAALDALAGAKALIIDIRWNPGGSDSVSFGIAGHFTDQSVEVFSKSTRAGTEQVNPFTAHLDPIGTSAERRPTVVLTSRLTGSAAEIFTMAMRDRPNVTIMGEPTSGGLSDVMGIVLPNGWGLGLSNQTYLTPDGELFEKIGVPPDTPITFEAEAFLAGRDPVLDAAVAFLNR